jgi:hypothetical protein
VELAGERLCDERANCRAAPTGGVQCDCERAGLRFKPGAPEDGRRCEQDASMRAVLESESVSIYVAKPGNLTNRTLTLIVEARGEAELNVTFKVTITRKEAGSELVTAASGSVHVDQPSVSAFGQHLEWKQRPPTATWLAGLNGALLKFADTSRHEFSVRLACDSAEPSCAADGDVITTIVQLVAIGSPSSPLHSEVHVVTQVQSLLSCEHTRAHIRVEPDSESMPLSAPIRVRLFAKDVDGLPINFTRAEIHLDFRGLSVPMQWVNRGSNEYTADVPTDPTAQPGLYALVVTASQAWNETAEQITRCELLRRNVRIVSVATTVDMQYIILGVLVGLAILALGTLLGCQIRAHKDKAKMFVESFFKHEGQLAAKICSDIWVRRTRALRHAFEHSRCARSLRDACRTSAETVRRPSPQLPRPLCSVFERPHVAGFVQSSAISASIGASFGISSSQRACSLSRHFYPRCWR